MQLPHHHDNCIFNNYLSSSPDQLSQPCYLCVLFFNLIVSFLNLRILLPRRSLQRIILNPQLIHFILSTISSAVFLSNILNASENILSTSSGLSIYSLISQRTPSRSGNIPISYSISCGVSATNNDRYFRRSSFIFSVTSLSLYCVLS